MGETRRSCNEHGDPKAGKSRKRQLPQVYWCIVYPKSSTVLLTIPRKGMLSGTTSHHTSLCERHHRLVHIVASHSIQCSYWRYQLTFVPYADTQRKIESCDWLYLPQPRTCIHVLTILRSVGRRCLCKATVTPVRAVKLLIRYRRSPCASIRGLQGPRLVGGSAPIMEIRFEPRVLIVRTLF